MLPATSDTGRPTSRPTIDFFAALNRIDSLIDVDAPIPFTITRGVIA